MQLNCEELKLESFTEYFYAIPGAPSMAVKPEQLRLEHCKIFIQSTSQGSRCLKMGAKILYLKEVHYYSPGPRVSSRKNEGGVGMKPCMHYYIVLLHYILYLY